MEKKNNVLVIVLLLLVIGLGGYIAYDKCFSSKKTDTTKKDETIVTKTEDGKWEDIATDDASFIDLYNFIKDDTYTTSRGAGIEDFNNNELAFLAFTLSKKEDVYTETNVDDKHIAHGVIDLNKVTPTLKEIFNKTSEIDYSRISGYVGYTAGIRFGRDVSENWGCGFQADKYDKENNKLEVSSGYGCGGTFGPQPKITKRKIVSAKKKDDTIVVVEKAIYYKEYTNSYNNVDNMNYIIYLDNRKEHQIDHLSFDADGIENKSISVDSYLDKASTITYTFKLNKDTNKYYFVGSVIK